MNIEYNKKNIKTLDIYISLKIIVNNVNQKHELNLENDKFMIITYNSKVKENSNRLKCINSEVIIMAK